MGRRPSPPEPPVLDTDAAAASIGAHPILFVGVANEAGIEPDAEQASNGREAWSPDAVARVAEAIAARGKRAPAPFPGLRKKGGRKPSRLEPAVAAADVRPERVAEVARALVAYGHYLRREPLMYERARMRATLDSVGIHLDSRGDSDAHLIATAIRFPGERAHFGSQMGGLKTWPVTRSAGSAVLDVLVLAGEVIDPPYAERRAIVQRFDRAIARVTSSNTNFRGEE